MYTTLRSSCAIDSVTIFTVLRSFMSHIPSMGRFKFVRSSVYNPARTAIERSNRTLATASENQRNSPCQNMESSKKAYNITANCTNSVIEKRSSTAQFELLC
jgi:hypothetical protein